MKTFLVQYQTKTGADSEVVVATSVANALRHVMQLLRVRGNPVALKVMSVKTIGSAK